MIRNALNLVAVVLLILPAQSIMSMNFEVKATNATVTTYTYLKQPRLEESGYTRGLKEGSFNYLKNGSVDLEEYVTYNPGISLNETNSSVTHTLKLNFTGTNGISEFFGKEFFESNVAVSAWKKIGYIDLSYNFTKKTGKYIDYVQLNGGDRIKGSLLNPSEMQPAIIKLGTVDASNNLPKLVPKTEKDNRVIGEYALGGSYPANKISVDASLSMDMEKEGSGYSFDYFGSVSNGTIETKDSWSRTNSTKGKHIEWEQESYSKGNLNITNNLRETGDYVTGPGGPVDWLPCCFADATHPKFEGNSSGWPSAGVYGTLSPQKLLPNMNNCSKTCIELCKSKSCANHGNNVACKSCSDDCLKNCEWACTLGNCTGYECINTYETNIGEYFTEAGIPSNKLPGISVTQTFKKAPVDDNFTKVTYTIKVKNSGYIKLEKINLTDLLPTNVTFHSIKYGDSTQSPTELERKTENNRQKIKWDIGDLDTGNAPKTVVIEARYKKDDARADADVRINEVLVEALALGQSVPPATSNLAQVSPK